MLKKNRASLPHLDLLLNNSSKLSFVKSTADHNCSTLIQQYPSEDKIGASLNADNFERQYYVLLQQPAHTP